MKLQANRLFQMTVMLRVQRQLAAVGTGCGRCGKKSHKTEDCTTNMTGVKCFKCGKTGHIGRNCLKQGQNKAGDNKTSKGGNQGQKGKPGPNAKGQK